MKLLLSKYKKTFLSILYYASHRKMRDLPTHNVIIPWYIRYQTFELSCKFAITKIYKKAHIIFKKVSFCNVQHKLEYPNSYIIIYVTIMNVVGGLYCNSPTIFIHISNQKTHISLLTKINVT